MATTGEGGCVSFCFLLILQSESLCECSAHAAKQEAVVRQAGTDTGDESGLMDRRRPPLALSLAAVRFCFQPPHPSSFQHTRSPIQQLLCTPSTSPPSTQVRADLAPIAMGDESGKAEATLPKCQSAAKSRAVDAKRAVQQMWMSS